MLAGWVGLYLFLLGMLKMGAAVQIWHGVVWVTATLFGMWIAAGGQKAEDGGQKTEGKGLSVVGKKWAVAGPLTFVAVALALFFSWIMGKFTDFSWDGMTSRGMTVLKVMHGNPLGPTDDWVLGHIAGGWVALAYDSWQAGKAINSLMILINLFVAVSVYKKILLNFAWAIVLGGLTALNPVAIYQLSSFQVDGITANLLCLLILGCLRFLFVGSEKYSSIFLIVITGIGLAASKRGLGMFYTAVVVCLFLLFFFQNNRNSFLKPLKLLTAAVLGYLLFLASRSEYLNAWKEGYGVGGGASQVRTYLCLSRPLIFAASAFSMTEGSPEKINLKPPFWTTRREIRIFEDLFPDPRAGGFGPFYSTAFLLAGLGCLGLLAAGKWKYAPGWFLVLASFGSSYFSQIWWARWTPQNWLLVVGMLMPLVAYGFGSSRVGRLRGFKVEGLKGLGEQGLDAEEVRRLEGWKGTWVRTFAVLGMVAAFLNVGIIALYYGIGMVRQERILNSQMYVASQLPQPLPIYLQREDYVFIASKYWLEERGISTREVAQNFDKPRMKIIRTHTRFPLPENWRSLLRRPEDEKVLRERGLVED